MHEGHVEDCCGCISPEIGARLIGILAALDLIYLLFNTVMLWPDPRIAISISGIVLRSYVSYYFIKFLLNESRETRNGWKHAMNLYTKILYLGNALVFVLLILYALYLKKEDTITASGAVGLFVFGSLFIFINVLYVCHFNKVVRTFVEKKNEEEASAAVYVDTAPYPY